MIHCWHEGLSYGVGSTLLRTAENCCFCGCRREVEYDLVLEAPPSGHGQYTPYRSSTRHKRAHPQDGEICQSKQQ